MVDEDGLLGPALEVAWRAADVARLAIMARFRGDFTVQAKADRTPVTEADREAEAAIREVIRMAFPGHRILGEELGSEGQGAELRWVIDPIDGTQSFARRLPLFATLIALCRGETTLLAVVDFPALDRRLHAVLGQGAWEGDRRLEATASFDPAQALICHGDRSQFEATERMELFDRLQGAAGLVRTYADAFGHALVATGSAALMVDPDLRPWDLAAPALLVSEAGGRVLTLPESTGDDRRLAISGVPSAVEWAGRLVGVED